VAGDEAHAAITMYPDGPWLQPGEDAPQPIATFLVDVAESRVIRVHGLVDDAGRMRVLQSASDAREDAAPATGSCAIAGSRRRTALGCSCHNPQYAAAFSSKRVPAWT
jgi:hypothetical protein